MTDVCNRGDYSAVLRLANNKGLSSIVVGMLGMKVFQSKALEFLQQTDAAKYLRNLFPAEL